jgi:hypothetical protein
MPIINISWDPSIVLKNADSVTDIINKELTSNLATLTTSGAHYMAKGDWVTIQDVDAIFDGTYEIISVTTNTFSYYKNNTNITLEQVSPPGIYIRNSTVNEIKQYDLWIKWDRVDDPNGEWSYKGRIPNNTSSFPVPAFYVKNEEVQPLPPDRFSVEVYAAGYPIQRGEGIPGDPGSPLLKLYQSISGAANYTIQFNGNGNTSGSTPSSDIALAGSTIIIPSGDTLVKTDYTFLSWNTSSDGTGTTYFPGDEVVVADGFTLYAQWSPWTIGSLPVDTSGNNDVFEGWYSTYAENKFVLLGNANNGDSYCIVSTDGENWTNGTVPAYGPGFPGYGWQSVVNGSGTFAAVAKYGGGYSADGETWSDSSSIYSIYPGINWGSITYGGSNFVAVNKSSNNECVAYSADGDTWTLSTSLSYPDPNAYAAFPNAVAYGNGVFIAVSRGFNSCLKSTDAINWTAFNSPLTGSVSGDTNEIYSCPRIIFGNGIFLMIGHSEFATSADGDTWTVIENPFTFQNIYDETNYYSFGYFGEWNNRGAIAFGDGKFLIMSQAEVTVSEELSISCAFSTNGSTWSSIQMNPSDFNTTNAIGGLNNPWYSGVYNNGKFYMFSGASVAKILSSNLTA